MAIQFQCPSCAAVRSVNVRLLGREIKCPECGGAVLLPSLAQLEKTKIEKQRAVPEAKQQHEATVRQLAQTATAVGLVEETSWQEAQDRMAAEERALAAASTRFTRPKPPLDEGMDMTPMVDVTFLLLIFFMITAAYSVQKSIQRPAQLQDQPSTSALESSVDENPDIVTVQVDEYNAYNVITSNWDRAAASKQDLIVTLNDAHAADASGNQPTKLIVQAHEDCIHASVVAALDAGREAQFESFEVNTVEQFD